MKKSFQVFGEMNERVFRTGSNQLWEFIKAGQERRFELAEKRREQIGTLEELEQYNKEMRERFIRELGGLIETTEPLEAQITGVSDRGGFTLENIIFKSRPHVYVTGNLYLPKGLRGPAPAVLFVCGHHKEGRMCEEYQQICRMLVQVGLVVFAIDPTGQGERSNYYDADSGTYQLSRAVADHDGCGVPAVATGRYLETWFLNDQMRAVDYMLTRPEIDPERIGITGNSGGGTQTVSMMICDQRIKAAAPATFLTDMRDFMYTGMAQDLEQMWPACVEYGFDHVNALMLFAPKPVAVLAVTSDFFPIEGTRKSVAEARRIYGLYGKEENIRLYEDDYWHCYTPELGVCAAEFFSEVFYGEKKSVNREAGVNIPECELCATKSGNVLGEIKDAVSIPEEVRALAACQRISRLSLPEEVRKERAKERLLKQIMYQREVVDFQPRFFQHATQKMEGYVAIRLSWWTQKRLFAAGTVIKSEKYETDMTIPAVIAVWDDGVRGIEGHEEWIMRQCELGKQVLILDVPGSGNIRQSEITGPNWEYKGHYGTLFRLGCDLMFRGDSLTAMHCYDVLRALELVETEFGVAEENITLYCDENDGVYGIVAGFLKERVKVECGERLLRSVEKEILGQETLQYHNTLNLILPGMLKYFDYEELI